MDEADRDFLQGYGETLAKLMFYGGNSYYKPRDDAPRVADVFWHWTEGNLHAGIGRPRALYVLYPWRGRDILCGGAVLPYYEFFNPGRLTDTEWKNMLDSKMCPDMPKWLRPIVSQQGRSQPDREPSGPVPARR